MAVVAGATLVALLRIRVNAVVTGLFLLIEVAALAGVAWLGFGTIAQPLVGLLAHPVMASATGLVVVSPASIGVASSIAIFALNGYGAAVYFGEEMHEAPKRIARAIIGSLILTLLFEIVPLFAILVSAPDLHALLVSEDPFGGIVREQGGATAGSFVAVAVVIAIINAIIACILACARFFYSTGRDRSWGAPIDQWMTAIHPRLGSPWIATLIVGGIGTACCLVPLQLLLVLSGTGLVAIYAGIALATIAGRRRGLMAHAPYQMPFYPLAPVLTLIALAYVIYTSWLDPHEGRPGLMMTALQIILSAAYYWLVVRRRGAWTAHSPAEEAA
jgi:amino acid transporter